MSEELRADPDPRERFESPFDVPHEPTPPARDAEADERLELLRCDPFERDAPREA